MQSVNFLKGAVVLLLREKLGPEKKRLQRLGARVVHAPVVRRVEESSDAGIAGALESWIVFTSVGGVEAFRKQLKRGLSERGKVACIGPATAQAVQKFFKCRAHFMPGAYTTEALGRELPVKRGESVFLVRSGNADQRLDRILQKRGAKVRRINPYRLVLRPLSSKVLRMLREGMITHVFFGSASQVKAFFQVHKPSLRAQRSNLMKRIFFHEIATPRSLIGTRDDKKTVQALAIGPETAKALREFGVKPLMAKTHTFDGLIDLLIKQWKRKP